MQITDDDNGGYELLKWWTTLDRGGWNKNRITFIFVYFVYLHCVSTCLADGLK